MIVCIDVMGDLNAKRSGSGSEPYCNIMFFLVLRQYNSGVTSNSDMVASSTRAHFLDLDIISRFILSFPPFLFFFHPTLFFSSATFIPFLQHYNHHRHYYYYYSLCIYPLTFLDGERVSCCSSRQVVISQ